MIPLSSDFIESLNSLPGVDTMGLVEALDTPPEVSIRLNHRKPLPEHPFHGPEDSIENVEWCIDGMYLPERPVFTLDPFFHGGAYYVQDASSMIYQQITEKLAKRLYDADKKSELRVLDFCAAPGGKTTAMLNALPDDSVIVSNEYVAARGKILRENLEKWGYPGVITTGCASSQYRGLPAMFDIIAVDAPCSGEGMMRKDEDARRQWSPGLVSQCAALQKEILSDLVGTIRPGGYLIYSTCTFNREEDEDNSLFVSNELCLDPVSLKDLELIGIEKASPAVIPGVEGLRFMPHMTRGEGLYVSVFRRPEEDDAENIVTLNSVHTEAPSTRKNKGKTKDHKGGNKKEGGTKLELSSAIVNELRGWIKRELNPHFELSGNLITMLTDSAYETLEILKRHGINVTGSGLPIGDLKGRAPKLELIPDSRLALNLGLNPEAFPSIELTIEEALQYLRGELSRLGENIPRGYVVVNYKGLSLGMMKNLGNRANNLFPKPWRIKIKN